MVMKTQLYTLLYFLEVRHRLHSVLAVFVVPHPMSEGWLQPNQISIDDDCVSIV